MTYRDPDINDPVYERELACIEVAKNATIAAKGEIRPTFAPKRTILNWFYIRFKTSHAVYQVPTVKSIYWLWERYRPTPWVYADNQGTLEAWLEILYGRDLSEGLSALIEDVESGMSKAYSSCAKRGVHITLKEKWQQVVERLTDQLPLY